MKEKIKERTKAIKRRYFALTDIDASPRLTPQDARALIGEEFYLSESTVRQILFDKKYSTRKNNKV